MKREMLAAVEAVKTPNAARRLIERNYREMKEYSRRLNSAKVLLGTDAPGIFLVEGFIPEVFLRHAGFSRRQRRIVSQLWGLNGKPKTRAQVKKELNASGSEVREAENKLRKAVSQEESRRYELMAQLEALHSDSKNFLFPRDSDLFIDRRERLLDALEGHAYALNSLRRHFPRKWAAPGFLAAAQKILRSIPLSSSAAQYEYHANRALKIGDAAHAARYIKKPVLAAKAFAALQKHLAVARALREERSVPSLVRLREKILAEPAYAHPLFAKVEEELLGQLRDRSEANVELRMRFPNQEVALSEAFKKRATDFLAGIKTRSQLREASSQLEQDWVKHLRDLSLSRRIYAPEEEREILRQEMEYEQMLKLLRLHLSTLHRE